MTITNAQLDELQARANAATPGPWAAYSDDVRLPFPKRGGLGRMRSTNLSVPEDEANADFVAHARTDIPDLIAAVRERDAEIERLRARVAELEAGDWQPIETAPKDGVEILLGYPEKTGRPARSTSGFWIEADEPIFEDCGAEFSCPEYGDPVCPAGWVTADGGFAEEAPPTHWRPLPAPPKK